MKISLAAAGGLILLVLLITLTRCGTTPSKHTGWPNLFPGTFQGFPGAGVIEAAADLVVLSVQVDQHARAFREGLLGGSQVEGWVRGTLSVGSDLTHAEATWIDPESRTVWVSLPEPKVLSAAIDHQASGLMDQRYGLWWLAPGSAYERELTEQAYRHTLDQLQGYPLDKNMVSRAKLHTDTVLRQLFEARGWDVRLRWRPGD